MEQYTINKEHLEAIMYGYASHIAAYDTKAISALDWFKKYGPRTPSPAKVEQENQNIDDLIEKETTRRLNSLQYNPEGVTKRDLIKMRVMRDMLFKRADSTTPPVKTDWEAKYKEANQFIIDLAKELGQEGLGYDDLSWTIEDFMEAARTKFEAPVKEAGQPELHVLRNLTLADIDAPTFTHTAEFRKHFDYIKEKFMEALKGQPAPSGLRWVKGAPSIRKEYHAKVKSKLNPNISFHGIIYPVKESPYWWATGNDFNYTIQDHEIVEYLSDSPAPVQVDPVLFAEWFSVNVRPFEGMYYVNEDPILDPAQLLEIYTRSLQNKP